MTEPYRVQLDVFSGPLDLLLYLIRRDELDIQDVVITRITEQYLKYVRLLEQLDPNGAADFLVMASTLVELKSRALLPSPPLEAMEEDEDDPRAQLVRQLLEYKRFKDVAATLGSAAEERAKRYVRKPADLPKELDGVELEEVEVWTLLEAFGRVMSAIGEGPTQHQVLYDDTPIELHAAEMVAVLEREGPQTFRSLFDGNRTRGEIVGRFLALLELVRKRRVRAEQGELFGEIYLFLLEEVEEEDEPEESVVSASEGVADETPARAPDAAVDADAADDFDDDEGDHDDFDDDEEDEDAFDEDHDEDDEDSEEDSAPDARQV